MNNQLRKIVEQAVSAVDIVTGNEALDDELAKMYIPDCFAEKFAELIQQDMHRKVIASILITDVVMEEKGQTPSSEDYIRAINKDFGVEE